MFWMLIQVLIPLTSIVLFVQVNGNQNCLATNIRKQYSAVERTSHMLLIILYIVALDSFAPPIMYFVPMWSRGPPDVLPDPKRS